MENQDEIGIHLPINPNQLIEELDALQPSKQQQNVVLFKELYPAVERALSRQVSQKSIVSSLEVKGLKISMGGFRSLLEAERASRAKTGDYLRCECCGSMLPATSQADTIN